MFMQGKHDAKASLYQCTCCVQTYTATNMCHAYTVGGKARKCEFEERKTEEGKR